MQSPIPRFFVTSSSLFCYIKLFYVYTTEDTEQHRVFIFKLIYNLNPRDYSIENLNFLIYRKVVEIPPL